MLPTLSIAIVKVYIVYHSLPFATGKVAAKKKVSKDTTNIGIPYHDRIRPILRRIGYTNAKLVS